MGKCPTPCKREAKLSGRGECPGNMSGGISSNHMKLVHWPLIGGLLHLVQRGGTGRGRIPLRPLLAVPNVTSHP